MDWSYRDGLLEVRLEGPFDPAQTLLCGQCFRWERTPSGFAGVVRGRALELTVSDGLFMLPGVLSRKKQLLPQILAVTRAVPKL